ncbi:hypothetical protein GCM10010250_39140 [Streptomyces althioticus]|nr:hypothetical protein GCM10010250_39140 [Streptomyces althioticus]
MPGHWEPYPENTQGAVGGDEVGVRVAPGEAVQGGGEGVPVAGDDGGAPPAAAGAAGQGPGDVGRPCAAPRRRVEPPRQLTGVGPQTAVGGRVEQHQGGPTDPGGPLVGQGWAGTRPVHGATGPRAGTLVPGCGAAGFPHPRIGSARGAIGFGCGKPAGLGGPLVGQGWAGTRPVHGAAGPRAGTLVPGRGAAGFPRTRVGSARAAIGSACRNGTARAGGADGSCVAVTVAPGFTRCAEAVRRERGVGRQAGRALGRRTRAVFAEHHMRVRPAEPEGRHSRGRRARVAGPRFGGGEDAQAQGVQVQVRVGFGEVQLAGEFVVVEGEDGLDESGDARCRLQVADVGLHRAEQQGLFGGAALSEHRAQRPGLDGVAERGAGAVGLDVVQLPAVGAVGVGQQVALGGGVGGGQAVGAAVGVHLGGGDHGEHAVAGPFGFGEALEDDDPAPLAAHHPVGRRVERLAPPVGGQRARPLESERHGRREQDVDAGGERHVAGAVGQGAHRVVDGDQGRRAGGVDGQARAPQVQRVGDAARGHAEGGAGRRPRGHRLRPPDGEMGVLGAADPDEDPGAGAGERGRGDRRVVEGLAGHFEQHPLLRVEGHGLVGGDTEELGVELLDVVQEAAVPAEVGGQDGTGRHEPLPASLGHGADGVPSVGEHLPVRGWGVGPAREAAADPDHGDRCPGRSRPRPGSGSRPRPRRPVPRRRGKRSSRLGRRVRRPGAGPPAR